MYTYLQLKQKVAELTQHVSYDSAGTATYDANFLGKIGTWLNASQKNLAQMYDFWTELQAIHSFDTSHPFAGVEAYSMPANFDKPFRVYDLTSTAEITPITEEEYSDANIANIADSTEGQPTQYRIYGVSSRLKQMKFGLIPDGVYSIRVLYKSVPTDMSADDDYPFMDADRYLIFDACGFAWKWESKENEATTAWGLADKALTVLLNNQMSNLGVQHKIVSSWAQAHRQ